MTATSMSAYNITQLPTFQKQNSTEEEIKHYLEKLNYETFIKLFPLVVILIVLIVVGVCGNLLVFLVYLKQFKASATRVFVLAMAVCDFMTNLFVLPWMIQDTRYRYTSKDPVCKMKRSLAVFPVVMSFLILTCVALDRRRRICQIHKRQLSERQAIYLLIVQFIVTSVAVFPLTLLYGVRPLETSLHGIEGTTCGYANTPSGRKVKEVYGIMMGIGYGAAFVLLLASYLHISYRIYQQKKKKNDFIIQLNANSASGVKRNLKKSKGIHEVTETMTSFICQSSSNIIDERLVSANTCSSECHAQDVFVPDESAKDSCRNVTEDVCRHTETARCSPKSKIETANVYTMTTSEQSSISATDNLSEIKVQPESAIASSSTSPAEKCGTSSADNIGQDCEDAISRSQDLQDAKRNRHKRALLTRTTVMMFVLTVATLVCYVPYIAMT